jgi:hypothetical protein
MISSCNVARLRTISRTKATRFMTIVCMLQTVAGSAPKCQKFCGRRGFEKRQDHLGRAVETAEGIFHRASLRIAAARLKPI